MNRSIDLRFRPNERQIHYGANGMVVRKDVNKMQMSAKVSTSGRRTRLRSRMAQKNPLAQGYCGALEALSRPSFPPRARFFVTAVVAFIPENVPRFEVGSSSSFAKGYPFLV